MFSHATEEERKLALSQSCHRRRKEASSVSVMPPMKTGMTFDAPKSQEPHQRHQRNSSTE
ncbi:hypothetical protein J6590_049773 [Homalodisca vitripennis]|nr:hypothetical protein J6590_049773 [Homalodisca vitripennis]